MTFCQLIEYNMRSIFLETSYTKCGGETSSRSFSKNQNVAWLSLWFKLSWIFMQFVSIICPSWRLQKYIETEVLVTCFCFTSRFKLEGDTTESL